MLKFIFLGIIQGITEFFPVSSSAHLVIFQHIFRIDKNVVFLDTVLHLGTLFSLVVFFRKDIFALVSNFFVTLLDIVIYRRLVYVWRNDEKFRLCVYIIITTAITGFIAFMGKDFFERQFESINTVILALFIISFVIFFTKNFNEGQRYLRHISLRDSIILGLTQGIAIIPGISRSGITISTLLFNNIEKESAFKFSFLISMPAILGAFILKLKDVQGLPLEIPKMYLAAGFFASFITGLAVLYILRLVLKGKSFYKFSYYCFILAVVVLILKLRYTL